MTPRLPLTRTAGAPVVAAAWLLAAAAGRAQEQPTLFLGDSPEPAAAREVKNVLLRPNAAVPFYPYVANPTPNDQTVTAVLLTPGGREIARASGIAVPANGRVPVTFSAPAARAGTPPAGPLALTGRQIRLRLFDERNKQIQQSDLDLAIQVPNQYAQAAAAFKGNWDRENQLRVTVSLTGPVPGGPVKLKLDLSRIPELVPESIKDGAFEAVATDAVPGVLSARNLRFTAKPRTGLVAVSVDGYDRAFLFATAFDGPNPQPPATKNVIAIVCKPYAQPNDKFPVRIEVDQPERSDTYVDFGFDRSGTGTFERRLLPADRDQAMTLKLGGPDGALVFGSVVKDWAFDLDATGVLGPRTLRARLLAPKTPDQKTLDPANDPELKTGSSPEEAKPAVDTRTVVFDNSPPENVKLVLPEEHVRGTPLKVRATAADPESGIDRVLFFVGDPPAANVVAAVRGKVFLAVPGTKAGEFTAVLPMADLKGPAAVGVRVINGVGLATDATGEVLLVDPPAAVAAAGAKAGAIKGVVTQGSEPRPQAGKKVYLLDEKVTALLKTTTTNDKGEFAFKDVAPGNYVVRSDKPTDLSMARQPVTVEAGKTSEVALNLKR